MNATELFIKIPGNDDNIVRWSDTYLSSSTYGLFLGLEFSFDVTDRIQIGDTLILDKDDKSFNTWIDGPTTVIGVTNSSIYATPSSLVFTDRPLQLPIVFTSSESGSIYLNDISQWQEVELSDTVSVPVTYNIADIRNISNKNTSFTKTLTIPGTKNNNNVFKKIYDIQGVNNYNTQIRVDFTLCNETIPVLEGYMQLSNIRAVDNKYWEYEFTLFGENANFSKQIDQSARLEDLNFSDLNHDYNLDSITQSWVGEWNSGYYYPYIDFNGGQKPDSKRVFNVENFRGSIYAKQYWDRIFKSYGYTYESEFLNSSTFKDLIIPPTKKVIENDPEWRFNSTFRAGLTQSATYSTPYGYQYTPFSSPTDPAIGLNMIPISFTPITVTENMTSVLQLDEVEFPNGDPGSNFIQVPLGEFYYKNVYQNTYDKSQQVVLNLDFDFGVDLFDGSTLSLSELLGTRLIFYCNIYKNNELISRKTILNYGASDVADININPVDAPGDALNNGLWSSLYGEPEVWSLDMFRRYQVQLVADTAGGLVIGADDEIRFKLSAVNIRRVVENNPDQTAGPVLQQFHWLNTRFTFDFFSTTNTLDGTYFYNNIDSELFDNQPYQISEVIPRNIKQIDFINSIGNMFNLYFYQDKNNPKNIFIEPRNQFYTSDYLDWSNKLDISKDIIQTPVVERYSRVLLSYKEDKDFYNNQYKVLTNEIYGQKEYITGDEFSNSQKKVDLIFSPTPLNMYKINDNIYNNSFIYSQIYDQKQPITSETFLKVDSNIRILYRKTINTTSSQLTVWDGGTQYLFDVYPYAGHLDDPFDATLDLCFEEPKLLFYQNDYSYPANNLYKEYYEQFFEEVYGKESKLITAYIYLNSKDILEFDYRKLIYLEDISSGAAGYFRINKLEWDPLNKQASRVELIKVLNNFKSVYRKILTIGDGQTLPGGSDGLITTGGNTNGGGSNIIGGFGQTIEGGSGNLVIGNNNDVKDDHNIVGGSDNEVKGGNNGIIGGRYSSVCNSYSAIIAGWSNSVSADRSVIIGGRCNEITYNSNRSNILGGSGNVIGLDTGTFSSIVINSFILGGVTNSIYVGTTLSNTENVSIIGGYGNIINPGITNSIIINGENLVATQSNTVYLEGNVLINGAAPSTITPITLNEIALGTGASITSNPLYLVTSARSVFLSNQSLTDNTSVGSIAMATDSLGIDGTNNTALSIFSGGDIGSGVVGSLMASSAGSTMSGTSRRSSIISASASQIIATPAFNLSIISSNNSQITGTNVSNSSIVGGNGLDLSESNTLMTSNLRADGVVRLANSSGNAAINAGATITINTTLITATSRVFVSAIAPIGATTTFYVDNIVAGTSFDITHTDPLGLNTTVSWLIINQ